MFFISRFIDVSYNQIYTCDKKKNEKKKGRKIRVPLSRDRVEGKQGTEDQESRPNTEAETAKARPSSISRANNPLESIIPTIETTLLEPEKLND